MTHSGKAWAWITGGLVFCTGTNLIFAAAAGNPYQGIVDRNAFSLKPPTPPPDPESLKPPPPKVILTGIMTIFGKKQALMKTPPGPPVKAGEPPKEKFYMLTEGQMEDDITVVQIDEKAGMVKLNTGGTPQTISFPTNAGPAMATGVPSPTGLPMPGGGMRTIPGRTLRVPGMPTMPGTPSASTGGGVPSSPGFVNAAAGQSGMQGGGITMPGFGSTASAQQQQSAAQQLSGPSLSAEESLIAIEANRERLKAQGSPVAGLLPPTGIRDIPKPRPTGTTPGTTPWQRPPGMPLTPPMPQ